MPLIWCLFIKWHRLEVVRSFYSVPCSVGHCRALFSRTQTFVLRVVYDCTLDIITYACAMHFTNTFILLLSLYVLPLPVGTHCVRQLTEFSLFSNNIEWNMLKPYSIRGLEWIFIQSCKKWSICTSRHQKTTSYLLRIHLKRKLRFGNGSPLEELCT